jgi:hypothetical protein
MGFCATSEVGRSASRERTSADFRALPKPLTPDSKLSELGTRFYSPELGRWESPSQVVRPEHGRSYLFVRNSPVCLADATSLDQPGQPPPPSFNSYIDWKYEALYYWQWAFSEPILRIVTIDHFPAALPKYLRATWFCRLSLNFVKVWAIPKRGFTTGPQLWDVFHENGYFRYKALIRIAKEGQEEQTGWDVPWRDVLWYIGPSPPGTPPGYGYPRRAHSSRGIPEPAVNLTIDRQISWAMTEDPAGQTGYEDLPRLSLKIENREDPLVP